MNTRILKAIKWASEKLQKIYDKQKNKIEQENTLPYIALSPTNNADEVEEYCTALSWAISNRKEKDIKNIALTGPYGSGKSSILKTFMANNTDKSIQFLYISLATFKDEKKENTPKPTKDDILRLIELSILQQIFYQEKDKEIPDSRFRKIKSFSKRQLRISTLIIAIVLLSLTHLIKPSLIPEQLGITLTLFIDKLLHWIALIISIIGAILLLYKSIRVISTINISKLNIQNAEISIGDNISKSILNHHLDEILYFFSVTPYNVVIIEDLDRFEQTDIFTKLREINLLINKSKNINKSVVFVYAVRDDMFKEDNERTKFFDFIIPVIPVINPSNSNNKLIEKINTNNYKISEDLVDSISLFIDDMRLLHNIVNEYYIYHKKLDKKLIQDKLLAIIVYKNLFPNDFTDLTFSKGRLYKSLNAKQDYIKTATNELKRKIEEWSKRIEELEYLKIKDIKEIRNSYILYAIEGVEQFFMYSVNNKKKTFDEMAEEINFEFLQTNNIYYYKRDPDVYSYNPFKLNTKFSAIENKVNPKLSYEERLKQVQDYHNDVLEQLKKQIQDTEFEIANLRHLTIKELITKIDIRFEIEHPKQKALVQILLQNGFIDENYLDYISIFYPGNISKEDNQFLLNVKTHIFTPFEHHLTKIENVIKKININDFSKSYIFNYQLTDYILG